MIPSVNTLNMQ